MPECVGLLPRGLTGHAGDVAPAIAERRPGDRGLIVTFLVPPALLFGMEALAVELDDQPAVLGVIAVTVAIRPVGLPEPGLLDRLGKRMGALDIPVVAILQDRVCTSGGHGDDLVKLIAPAELPAEPRHCPQVIFPQQPSVESAGNDGNDIIPIRGRLHEVEHCLLGNAVRRDPGWAPHHSFTRRQVNEDTLGWRDAPICRNGHINDRGRAIDEPVDLGRSLVAEIRASPGIKDRCPQLSISGHRSGKGQVNTSVNLPPPAGLDLRVDQPMRQPGTQRLPPAHHACLVASKCCQLRRYFVTHAADYQASHRQPSRPARFIVKR